MRILLILTLLVPSFAQATYNCTVTTQTEVSVTSGSFALALAANPNRRCLSIQNQVASGSSTVSVKFLPSGMTTQNVTFTGATGISVAPGVPWQPIILPANAVYLKSSGGTVITSVIEGE